MRAEKSRVKITISKEEYNVIADAMRLFKEMEEVLYNQDLDSLDFSKELTNLLDILGIIDDGFEPAKRGAEYVMEVE